MRRYAIAAVFLMLCASCSMPQTKIYSLVMPEEKPLPSASSGAPLNISVSSPRYLKQSYIAYRTSPYQTEISRYSRWDGPPDDLVRGAFRDALAASGLFREVRVSPAAPSGYNTLEIDLKRFEREDEGDASFARLLIVVRLRAEDGKELFVDTFSRKVRLPDRTFPELARALSEALSGDIAQTKNAIAEAMKGVK